jgi:L-alanine-DL-glutamate epimerase-like enolase superfamily enzyme
MTCCEARIGTVAAAAFRIPTDAPEADGTIAWNHTTLVVVEITAGGARGLGYTYADTATARLIHDELAEVVAGHDAFDVPEVYFAAVAHARNLGRPGITSMALSAVDTALWDLKAKLLDVSLTRLLGRARPEVPVYGSGGFTSYDLDRLQRQLAGWVGQGIPRVKMKVGSRPAEDLGRVRAARAAIGDGPELFVDANGAYSRKQALRMAELFAPLGVTWFEEPVSSDDLEGLRLLRDRGPAGVEIAAGEYGYAMVYFKRMIDAGAVDVLQADATRCGGFTGFMRVAAQCDAAKLPLSAHCAPSLHLHVGCAAKSMRHLEYFHDHVRIEHMLFDGARDPVQGALSPDLERPGLGLELKRKDAAKYAV